MTANTQPHTQQSGGDELEDFWYRIKEIAASYYPYVNDGKDNTKMWNSMLRQIETEHNKRLQTRERAARADERQFALSELDADNQIQQRDFDLSRDFLDGWQDAISTAAKQRDDRLQQLQAELAKAAAERWGQ